MLYNYIKDKIKTAMLYPHDSPIVGGSLVDFMRFFGSMPLSALISKALITYAFDELHAQRVEALAMKANTASCRVLEKSGMTREGILKNFTKIDEIYHDVCYYGIIESEYKGDLY